MNYNKIIIGLLIVIIIIIVAGIIVFNPLNAKTDTILTVTSEDTLSDGDCFSISLTDINGTPLANQSVNITIIDANGGENHQHVTTDGMGNAMLQLNGLTPGYYTVNVTYGGNDNYSANSTTQKLHMKEKVEVTSSTSSSNLDGYEYSEQYGTYVRQYTDSNGAQHIVGSNGMHEVYNPSTGVLRYDDGHGHVDYDYRG